MYEKPTDNQPPDWKFFGLPHSLFKVLLAGSFLILISLIIFWMYRSYYFINPFVPNGSDLRGTALYGRDLEGSLESSGVFFLIETSVALLVLVPYSFSRSYWARLLILGVLYGGWWFLLLLPAMHSGSLYMINIAGVFGIDVLIGFWMVLTLIADHKNRTNLATQWNSNNNSRPNN